jgi:hypothetical protein
MNEAKISLIETHQSLKDSLDVTVKIDWRQVLKITVEDLIKKYRSCVERKSDHQHAFKEVLLYYLGDKDFEKYVTNFHPID